MSTETDEARLARLTRELQRLETEKWFLDRQREHIAQQVSAHRRYLEVLGAKLRGRADAFAAALVAARHTKLRQLRDIENGPQTSRQGQPSNGPAGDRPGFVPGWLNDELRRKGLLSEDNLK